MPTLSTIELSRRWGTRLKPGSVGTLNVRAEARTYLRSNNRNNKGNGALLYTVFWSCVHANGSAGVDVWVGGVVFTSGVVGDVEKLVFVVFVVCNAVGVIALLPNFACELLPDGEGVAAFYELRCFFDRF